MKLEPEAQGVSKLPELKFWLGIHLSSAPHMFAARVGVKKFGTTASTRRAEFSA